MEFTSNILREATIEYSGFNMIEKIIINSGNYTEEQKKFFIEELERILLSQFANLEMIDLSNIELDENALKEIFRRAGTANIQVNLESSFYETLQQISDLSDVCKRRIRISESSTNLQLYKKLAELKRTSFSGAIIPAKDLLRLNEFMYISYARLYHICINDSEDIEAFRKIKDMVLPKNQIIFVREGISLDANDINGYEVISNVKEGNIDLSKEEGLFNSGHSTDNKHDDPYREAKEKLDTEELILSAMKNKCIPARALRLIGNETLDSITNVTLSVQTEEDRRILDEFKGAMQGKRVSLVSSTVRQMPLEILDGLNIDRVMVGTDENKECKYNPETYRKIYEELKKVTEGIDERESEYGKFQTIYERIAKILKYDYKSYQGSEEYDEEHMRKTGHSVIFDPNVGRDVSRIANLEVLVNNGECVCAGYAEVLRQALSIIGIESHYIVGETDRGSGHAWNRVVLNGKLYNCDLTSDASEVKQFGIYKKARPRRVLRNNPNLSRKIMPRCYLRSDKEFGKDHFPFIKYEEVAEEDFDADSYYRKDFRAFVRNILSSVSARACKMAEIIMGHDIEEWERSKGIRKEIVNDDRDI